MSKAERKPSESEADAKKRNSYEETPEGRPARRRAEEKDASDESTVLEVFLHCIALKVCQTMAKLQAFCPVKGTEGARTLKTAQEREQANTQICQP